MQCKTITLTPESKPALFAVARVLNFYLHSIEYMKLHGGDDHGGDKYNDSVAIHIATNDNYFKTTLYPQDKKIRKQAMKSLLLPIGRRFSTASKSKMHTIRCGHV